MATAGVLDRTRYNGRWEANWGSADSVPPGQLWDAERSAPSLVKLLADSPLAKGKRVVVPGCGRGYDLVEFSRHGAEHVLGVEISPSAVRVAREYAAHTSPRASIEVREADWMGEGLADQYDVGYDYTFFCAIHPSMRRDWAASWAKHIRPSGMLITLMYPISKEKNEGPPWPVQPEDYENVLEPYFVCLQQTAVPAEDATQERRVGKEVMAVWTRKENA